MQQANSTPNVLRRLDKTQGLKRRNRIHTCLTFEFLPSQHLDLSMGTCLWEHLPGLRAA